MATANAPATLDKAQSFSTNWANSSLVVKQNSTVLATFPIANWTAQNIGNDASAVSNTPADVNASQTGVATVVELTKGTKTYVLNIGTDLTLSNNNFTAGQPCSSSAVTVTFRASQ